MNKQRQTLSYIILCLGFIASLLLAACKSSQSNSAPTAPAPTGEGLTVLFSGPTVNAESVLQPLVAAMDQAESSIDVAIYSLSLDEIEKALIRAAKRGVSVRVVVESEGRNQTTRDLEKAGIRVVDDRKDSLMHQKFVVIDQQWLWTGSANLTNSTLVNDRNNILMLQDKEIAAQFVKQFERMYLDYHFGESRRSPADSLTKFTLNGTELNIFFSPEDDPQRALLALLQSAQKEIKFLTYSFTDNATANTLIDRSEKGILVEGVFDQKMEAENTGTEYGWLQQHNVPVCLDGEPGLMHNKVFIVDEKWVVTGSMNFTRSGMQKNDDTMLILQDPSIVQQYLQEYDAIKALCKP